MNIASRKAPARVRTVYHPILHQLRFCFGEGVGVEEPESEASPTSVVVSSEGFVSNGCLSLSTTAFGVDMVVEVQGGIDMATLHLQDCGSGIGYFDC